MGARRLRSRERESPRDRSGAASWGNRDRTNVDAAAPSVCGQNAGAVAPAPASFKCVLLYFPRGTVGIMMWAYGVPFHITQGAPLFGSVGNPSSIRLSGTITMMCGPPFSTH